MDRDSLVSLLAQGLSVERIGKRFGKHPSTVSYWMKKYALVAPNREKHAAKGGIERARLEELVDAGNTVAGIADELDLSAATVRLWLRRHGLQTVASRRGALVREARDGGQLHLRMECRQHGEADFVLEGRGYYRCKRCRQERVADRRRNLKRILVAEAGGGCAICGYDRFLGALQFHHLDPGQKRLEISRNGITLSLAALRTEAHKCALVCSNCHAELEGGVVVLPGIVDLDTVQDSES
ncbi:MAG TPA: helix-turn-helix domain-containing protein [Solirubrobacteraceae bacterium]